MTTIHCRALTPALLATAALACLADEPASLAISTGVRLWSDTWEANAFPYASISPSPGASGTPLRQTVSRLHGTTQVVMPTVSASYGDWALTATAALPRTFHLDGDLASYNSRRHEEDLSLAYYLSPRFNVGVGYKRIGGWGADIAGPVVSFGGAAPLGNGLTLYGGAGVGHLRTRLEEAGYSMGTAYVVSEIGLNYALGNLDDSLKRFSALVGYRNQRITAHGVRLKDASGAVYTSVDVNDLTSGPVIGLMARF